MDWVKTTAKRDGKHLIFGIWCGLYQMFKGNVNLMTPIHRVSGDHRGGVLAKISLTNCLFANSYWIWFWIPNQICLSGRDVYVELQWWRSMRCNFGDKCRGAIEAPSLKFAVRYIFVLQKFLWAPLSQTQNLTGIPVPLYRYDIKQVKSASPFWK